MSTDKQDLLGLAEVAELLGVSRQVVSNWRSRRDAFPAPAAELKSGPIWRRVDVVEWAAATGIELVEEEVGDEAAALPGRGTTVALMNMKGGVGKSTIAANLGWFAAFRRDARVLLVDLDPQFNLSQYLMGNAAYERHLQERGATVLDIFEHGTPTAVSGAPSKPELTTDRVIATVRSWDDGSRIDLIPSSLELGWTLKNPAGKEQLLRNFLNRVRSSYDLILVDCPPTDSMLTTAAYLACESVLIPVRPEFLSTIGIPLMVRSIREFQQAYDETIEILGILFNAATDKAEHERSRAYVGKLADENGFYVFQHEVAYSDSYPSGSRQGSPIFLTSYARRERILNFYAVADEFYGRLMRDETE